MRRVTSVFFIAVALAACGKSKNAETELRTEKTSSAPVTAEKKAQEGLSELSRNRIETYSGPALLTCQSAMINTKLLINHVAAPDGTIVTWDSIAKDVEAAHEKTGKVYRQWIANLQPFPGVQTKLKELRAEELDCSADKILAVKHNELDPDEYIDRYRSKLDLAMNALKSEIDAVPIVENPASPHFTTPYDDKEISALP